LSIVHTNQTIEKDGFGCAMDYFRNFQSKFLEQYSKTKHFIKVLDEESIDGEP
jgi:hypothetical protein